MYRMTIHSNTGTQYYPIPCTFFLFEALLEASLSELGSQQQPKALSCEEKAKENIVSHMYSIKGNEDEARRTTRLCGPGFLGGSAEENPPVNARDRGSIPDPGRSHLSGAAKLLCLHD